MVEAVLTRLAVRRLVCGIALAAVAAIPHAHAQSPSPARVFLDLLPVLRTGMTVAQWLKTHADRDVEFSPSDRLAPGGHDPREACAHAEWTQMTTRGLVTVRLVFVTPEMDVAAIPPFDASRGDVRHQCRAGSVKVTTDVPVLPAEDEREVATALGAPQRGSVTATGFAVMRDSPYWRQDRLAAFLAMSRRNTAADPQHLTPFAVFVAAHDRAHERMQLPSRVFDIDIGYAREMARKARFAERVVEAIGLSGQPASRQQVALSFVTRYAARPGSPPPIQGPEAEQWMALMGQWAEAAKTLSAPMRAASLLAADGLLEVGSAVWAEEAMVGAREQLTAHGASFMMYPLGGGEFGSRHAWLREAAVLGGDGRSAELVLLERLERGVELSVACLDQAGTGFRAVIKEGVRYLDTHPGSRIAGDVQLLVGDAWADIVAMAAGAAEDFSDPKDYAPEVAHARAQALAAYRQAWALGASPGHLRSSWNTVWNLLAGFPPRMTSFFCAYD